MFALTRIPLNLQLYVKFNGKCRYANIQKREDESVGVNFLSELLEHEGLDLACIELVWMSDCPKRKP